MAEARLVLTDALIAEALRRGKHAEREAQGGWQSEPAGHPRHRDDFRRMAGERRHVAQHKGE
jgi:hypothetical protein